MLTFIILVAFMFHFLPVVGRNDSQAAKLFLLSYVAGFFIFVLLPSYYPITFGKQMLEMGFAAEVAPDSEVMGRLYFLIGIFLLGSYIGFGLAYLSISNSRAASDRGYFVSKKSLQTINIALAVVISFKVVMLLIDVGSGLLVTGNRGSIFSPLSRMVVNSLLSVFFAIKIGSSKDKPMVIKVAALYGVLLFSEAVFVDGSRRNIVYYILFFVLPYFYFMKWIRMRQIAITGVPILAFVLGFGIMRVYMGEGGLSSGFDALIAVAQNPQGSVEAMLLTSDFPVIYDALLGTLIMVPQHVDYLYGATLLKFFYFFVPRYVWPEKPESITVIVSALVYGRGDSNLVSFGPSTIGELYFNGGSLVVFGGAAVAGFLLRIGMVRINNIYRSGWTGDLYFVGVFYVAALNIWRGYTFETIFTALSSWLIYLYISRTFVRRGHKDRVWQKKIICK